MRLVLTAAVFSLLGLASVSAAALAEAVKVSPELTVFTSDDSSQDAQGPTVLRGSATKRGTVHGGGNRGGAGSYQINAGETLWITDPETGSIIACEPRRTSRVGSRFVRCFD